MEKTTEPKRSLWDSVRSAFVEEVPEPAKEQAEQAAQAGVPYNPAAPDTPSPNAVRPEPPVNKVELEPALVADIRNAVLKKVPAGWAELEAQLDTLKAIIPDEGLCYKAAIAVVSKKTSTEQLAQDAQTCMDLLDAELIKFNDEFNDQQNAKVGKRNQKIADLNSELTQLATRIAELTKQRDEETVAVNTAMGSLKTAHDKFILAHGCVKKEFLEKKEKLSTYGKNS